MGSNMAEHFEDFENWKQSEDQIESQNITKDFTAKFTANTTIDRMMVDEVAGWIRLAGKGKQANVDEWKATKTLYNRVCNVYGSTECTVENVRTWGVTSQPLNHRFVVDKSARSRRWFTISRGCTGELCWIRLLMCTREATSNTMAILPERTNREISFRAISLSGWFQFFGRFLYRF